MARIGGYLRQALESLVSALETAPETPVGLLDILPASERDQVLVSWNDTARPFPEALCLHELVEAQASARPEATAVIFGETALSYGELNARSNRLARRLVALGVKPDERVAICVERSLEMVVGVLAVLKAGGAYVPLDPTYPADRLAYMLEDSAARVVLTHGLVGARSALEPADGGAGRGLTRRSWTWTPTPPTGRTRPRTTLRRTRWGSPRATWPM